MFIMLSNAIQSQQQTIAGTSGQQCSYSITLAQCTSAIVLACSSVAAPTTFCRRLFASPSLLSPSPVSSQCDGCLEDYVGAHGWVVRLPAMGALYCLVERLVTVEDPSFIQHDAVGERKLMK